MRSASFAERHVTSTTSLSVVRAVSRCFARGGRKFTLANRVLRSPCLQAKIQYVFLASDAILSELRLARRDGRGFYVWRRRRAAAAIAGHVLSLKKSPTLIVGYDTRFFSEEFARTAASVLEKHSCKVLFCNEFTPTPTIAHAILYGKLDSSVNITASHNPAGTTV